MLVTEYYLTTESPRRGETFVTRKITLTLSKIIFELKVVYIWEICTH